MTYRLHRAAGPPHEAGVALGRLVGARLGATIERYLATWPPQDGVIDRAQLVAGASPWLDRLPQRYRDEIVGIAEGSGVPTTTIAAGYFAEECCACSGFVTSLGARTWVGRNNDAWAPDLWNGVTIHEIDGRTPRMGFGLAGDTFTSTGINRDRLWLHYHAGPASDAPSRDGPSFQPHVVMTEALETCASIAEVETILESWTRTRGMILFAVDGKTTESAIFDCDCTAHRRRSTAAPLVGANHREDDDATDPDPGRDRSIARCARMNTLLAALPADAGPDALRTVLADDGVERREPHRTTVFSNLACPATGEVWFACGDGPSASTGNWARVPWPW